MPPPSSHWISPLYFFHLNCAWKTDFIILPSHNPTWHISFAMTLKFYISRSGLQHMRFVWNSCSIISCVHFHRIWSTWNSTSEHPNKCIDFQGQSRWKSTNLHHLKIQDYTSDKMERTRTLSGTMCLCLRCGLGQNFMRKTREQMHFAASFQGQCESEKSSTQFHALRRCLCWQTDVMHSTENRCDALAPHCHWQLSIFFSASMYGSKAEVAMQKINKTRVSSAKCNLCWIWVLDILKHFAGYFWVVVATNFAPESCIVCAMNVFSEAEFLCLNNNCSMSTPHRDRTIKYIFWYRFWLQRRRFWQTAQW